MTTADEQDELMRKAVRMLMKVHGVDERTAASLMMTVRMAVGLAPKPKQ
jgi:hypothetical protein